MKNVKLVLGTMTFGESVFNPDVHSFIEYFLEAGFDELDTAYVYNEGLCEKILGDALKNIKMPYKIATKVNPRISGRLDGNAAYKQVNESLNRLKHKSVDVVYLHFPDPATPVVDVLQAMEDLHKQGKFKELGLSNYPAWMVSDVWHICNEKGWVKPTVFEGIYNPLTRNAEKELNACLDHFGLRFYAYNPLAGGLLTGRYDDFEQEPSDGRFTHRPNYQKRYWKKSFFEAVKLIKCTAESDKISLVDAVYRWLAFHSMLNGQRGDAIIIGASKMNHLRQNIEALKAGPLTESILQAFEEAWNICRIDSPEYYTLYSGKGSVGGKS